MKNFLDLTDISLDNKLEVKFNLVEHNNPKYLFTLNGLPITSVMYFGLLDNLFFNCEIFQGAIEIINVSINDKEILPIYLNHANPPTSWITGNWSFTISQPFYPWYHEITGQGWIA